MKALALIVVAIFTAAVSANGQVIDSAPTGDQNYRAIEGDRERANVDAKTPLPDLIKRFQKPWQFVETGKAYWIGYTDDMYSIAAHGEGAIKPLMDFIASTNVYKAKIGAVYTLHLIGIGRKIAGRFYEEFNNKQARIALLSLLRNEDLAETVMSLLKRDPWLSDVPSLFSVMELGKLSYWYIINSLSRYELGSLPIKQKVPANIAAMEFSFPYSDPQSLSADFDFDGQILGILHTLKTLNNPLINIEDKLFDEKISGGDVYKINGKWLSKNKWGIGLSDFLDEVFRKGLYASFDYDDTGNNIQYYIKDEHLYICTSETAKKILLDWWKRQPGKDMEKFSEDKSAIRKRVEQASHGK